MNSILSFLAAIAFLFLTPSIQAQEDKSKRPSPPAVVKGMIDNADVAIYYSSPAIKGRMIWGGLVPYGKIWRTGANEATIFETNKEIRLNENVLPAGKYGLFTVPGEKEWTIVLNSVWDQWGAFKYDQSRDILRFKVPVEKSPAFNERLKFDIVDNDVVFYWENIKVSFNVNGPGKQTTSEIRVSPPASAKSIVDGVNILISYSQPGVIGRTIWGGLVPYDEVWRTGANEATTIEIDKDLIVQGQKLPAGKYAIFTIPGEKEWTVLFNSEWNQWGCFTYDPTKDVLRIKATPSMSASFNERMKFEIGDNSIVLHWENLQLAIPVKG